MKRRSSTAYSVTFGLVGVTVLVALAANAYIEHEKNENPDRNAQVVINISEGKSDDKSSTVDDLDKTETEQDEVEVIQNDLDPVVENLPDEEEVETVYTFEDGVYTSRQVYEVKGHGEDVVDYIIDVEEDKITSFETNFISGERKSEDYVNNYVDVVAPQIAGLNLEDIDSAFLSGSTLTSDAFEDALVEIKKEAEL